MATGLVNVSNILSAGEYRQDFKYYREVGGYNSETGEYFRIFPAAISAFGSVQPVPREELHELTKWLDGGGRLRSAILIFTQANLQASESPSSSSGDIVEYGGKSWRVVEIQDYSPHGHKEVIAVNTDEEIPVIDYLLTRNVLDYVWNHDEYEVGDMKVANEFVIEYDSEAMSNRFPNGTILSMFSMRKDETLTGIVSVESRGIDTDYVRFNNGTTLQGSNAFSFPRTAGKIEHVKISLTLVNGKKVLNVYVDDIEVIVTPDPTFTGDPNDVKFGFIGDSWVASFNVANGFYGLIGKVSISCDGEVRRLFDTPSINDSNIPELIVNNDVKWTKRETALGTDIIGEYYPPNANMINKESLPIYEYVDDSPFNPVELPDLSAVPTDTDMCMLKWDGNLIVFENYGGSVWKYTDMFVNGVEHILRDPTLFTWNEQCWYNNPAKYCMSVWSDRHWFSGQAVLITPRHVVMAYHIVDEEDGGFPLDVIFMDANNVQQRVTVVEGEHLEGSYTDIAVCILEEEVTLDIEPVNFVTDDDYEALTKLGNSECYCLGSSREGRMTCEVLRGFSDLYSSYHSYESEEANPAYKWTREYARVGDDPVGDSSRGVFLMHDGHLFFMFTTRHQFGGYSMVLPDVKLRIQNSVNRLSDKYGVTGTYYLTMRSMFGS